MLRIAPALLLLCAAPVAAQTLTVTGGGLDQTNVVVTAPLPAGLDPSVNSVALPGGQHAPAQVAEPAIVPGGNGKVLAFVLPKLPAGAKVDVRPETIKYVKAPAQFSFADKSGEGLDVLFDGKPVLRFVNVPHDPAKHYATFKPFHHVYSPADGKTFLTNGSAATPKDGLFPHHRGLFFGFNKTSYGDKKAADVWHGNKGEFSNVEKLTLTEAGEVLGRHRAAITWHGQDGKTFAAEEREVTAYHVPGGTLIDWATVLKTELPKVRLDGDPQHAGFHFRAAMEVAQATKDQTYYVRPDGKDKPGSFRNWAAKAPDPKAVNVPWDAASFVVGGKRYTVLRIVHPDNPKETRGSERDYARFGDYFEYDLTPENPLKLRYRVWAQEGEMTVEQCAAIADAFVNPPKVAAK